MDNKGNGGIIAIIGVAFIIAGFIVGLYTFAVTRGQATNPDVPQMFSTFLIGIIIAIILVAIGVIMAVLGARS